MADLTPGMRKALSLYQSIKAAAAQGQSTAEVWATLRTAAESAGQTLAGISATDVSRLRGAAAAELRAAENLRQAPFGATIDASMISTAPYARSLPEMNAAPRYNVTIELGYLRNGEFGTANYVVSYTGFLPPTTDQLLTDLQGHAAAFGQQYGFTAGDILDANIVAV